MFTFGKHNRSWWSQHRGPTNRDRLLTYKQLLYLHNEGSGIYKFIITQLGDQLSCIISSHTDSGTAIQLLSI